MPSEEEEDDDDEELFLRLDRTPPTTPPTMARIMTNAIIPPTIHFNRLLPEVCLLSQALFSDSAPGKLELPGTGLYDPLGFLEPNMPAAAAAPAPAPTAAAGAAPS